MALRKIDISGMEPVDTKVDGRPEITFVAISDLIVDERYQRAIEQEAAAFSWINGAVTVLSQNQIFKAALAAFEPWAVQCDAAVRRADCSLMTSTYSAAAKKPGQVFCVSIVRKFVEQGHAAQLATVLKGIGASEVRDEVPYYNSFGLSSLVPAVIAAGVTRSEAVTSFLNAHDLEKTAQMVRRVQELPENKGKSFKALFGQSVLVLMKQHMRGEAA